MKKKIIVMFMAASMVMSSASFAMAASAEGASAEKICGEKIFEKIMQMIHSSWQDKNDTEEEAKPEAPQETPEKLPASAAEVISLTNEQRAAAGLRKLEADAALSKVAQMKAEDMAQSGYFSHTSPTYGSAFDMLSAAGISYRTAGENIAKGQTSPKAVMSGWMNSSGHRANILSSSYTHIGVGSAKDKNGTIYWVQIFRG